MEGKKIELKPCPFCGGRADFEIIGNTSNYLEVGFDFIIKCSECGIHNPRRHKVTLLLENSGQISTIIDERQEAIDGWNRRTGDGTSRSD